MTPRPTDPETILTTGARSPALVRDLGVMSYNDAFEAQRRWLDAVLAARDGAAPSEMGLEGKVGALLLVEHDPPVITISRRPNAKEHLIATSAQLEQLGVTVEPTDRGGDITYHGPGQLVVYPILDLNLLGRNLHSYMRLLESVVIRVCEGWGIDARRDPSATGVWVDGAKVCAMGVRIRRWVSMHGLALNVDPNMRHFDCIVPCGLAGRSVTSLRMLLGDRAPSMDEVKQAMVEAFQRELAGCLANDA